MRTVTSCLTCPNADRCATLDVGKRQCDKATKLVTGISADEMVDWLIKSHGLDPAKRDTVRYNLDEQFAVHRVYGRADTSGAMLALIGKTVTVTVERKDG